MRFGVHLSMSEGPSRGAQIGCQALQIFCGNPRAWSKKPLEADEVSAFREGVREAGLDPVVVHATYLINLAAPDQRIWDLSVAAFIEELDRSQTLGAKYYVVHSGSHKGEGEDLGRKRIAEAIKRADRELPKRPEILLENTAGTKNSLGTTWKDLAILLDGAGAGRTGICMDTCHSLAAGYEIRTPDGVRRTLDELEADLGLARLRCLHINDSKGDLNSRIDRHDHIGAGAIGAAGFRAFFADSRLWQLPAILETPQDEPDDDHRDLWHAVELACEAGAVSDAVLAGLPTVELEALRDEEIAAAQAAAPKAAKPKSAPRRKPAPARKAAAARVRMARRKTAQKKRKTR